MPRLSQAPVSMFQAPLVRTGASPHARELEGRGEALGGRCRLLHLGSLGTPAVAFPASGEVAAALPVAAAAGVFAALVFAAAVVDVAVAAVAPPGPVGAGSPRDCASSRRRVLIMPSRDAIWRWSEAVIACSAVGGGGGWTGPPPLVRPLQRGGAAPPPRRWSRTVHPREMEPAPRLWP